MLLIVNPISGTRRNPSLAGKLVNKLRAKGKDVELRLTEYAGHAHELALEAAEKGEDSVLACGGDGTVNEIASGLIGSSTILGILPNGSGNGLARHIGIPCDPMKAIDIVVGGVDQACDWCEADGHPFFCAFGVGFDAAVAHRFASKPSRGLSTYVMSALEVFRNYKPLNYTILTPQDELHTQAMMLSFCNASQFGNNAYIAPHASIADGKMDIAVVEKSNILRYARLGLGMMGGALHDSPGLKMLSAAEATIYRDEEGPVHLDGEPMMLGSEIHVKLHPADLRIFINPLRRPIKPWLTPLHLD